MKIYASAETVKENISYIVDWIGFGLPEGRYIIFDLQGEQDYTAGLNVRVKGEALPWALWDEEGEEIDLSELDDDEIKKLGIPTIAELLETKPAITLGFGIDTGNSDMDIFDRWKLAQNDVFTNKQLRVELPEGKYEFNDFEIEILGE